MDERPTVPRHRNRHRHRPRAAASGRAAVGAALLALAATASAGYTVQSGDTLSDIAVREGVSTSELAVANGLEDPDLVIAGAALTLPEAAPDATRAVAPVSGPPARAAARADVGALIDETARRYGWNPSTVKALAWQESGWRQDVVSSAGAVGIMQVLPSTGEWLSTYVVGRPLDLSDPEDNVEAGMAFLDHLYGEADGDVRRTLGGYYQGAASLEARGPYDDTEAYIDSILNLRERF